MWSAIIIAAASQYAGAGRLSKPSPSALEYPPRIGPLCRLDTLQVGIQDETVEALRERADKGLRGLQALMGME